MAHFLLLLLTPFLLFFMFGVPILLVRYFWRKMK